MPVAYNSQRAPGGASINPVVAPELASLAPLPPPNAQLLLLLSPSLSETNFANFVRQLQLCYLAAFLYHTKNLSCPENYL